MRFASGAINLNNERTNEKKKKRNYCGIGPVLDGYFFLITDNCGLRLITFCYCYFPFKIDRTGPSAFSFQSKFTVVAVSQTGARATIYVQFCPLRCRRVRRLKCKKLFSCAFSRSSAKRYP